MKTYNFTTPTRQALRNLNKLMKANGIITTTNERSKNRGGVWGITMFTGSTLVLSPSRKRFDVVNGKVVKA